MKHSELSDWLKFYLTILDDLKQDCALKGTMEAEWYSSLWQVIVLLAMPLWVIMWERLTTSQQESIFHGCVNYLFYEDRIGFIGIIFVCSQLMCVEGEY